MTNTQIADPRPAYAVATTWVTELLNGVTDEQWTAATPCEEFDVRTLGAHLIATANRAVALAEGADALALPRLADQHDADTYAATVAKAGCNSIRRQSGASSSTAPNTPCEASPHQARRGDGE